MRRKIDLNTFLFYKIFKRTLQYTMENRNRTIIIDGDTGSGKSWTALSEKYILDSLRAGYMLSKNEFDYDGIVFDPRDLLNLIKTSKKRTIVFDEGGVGANARKWYDAANIALSQTFQVMRFKTNIIIVTVPRFEMIDKHIRELSNERHHINPKGRVGFFNEVAIRELNYNPQTGEIIQARPKFSITLDEYNRLVPSILSPDVELKIAKRRFLVVNSIYIPAPPKWLAREYEKRSAEYKEKVIDEALMTIEAILGETSDEDIEKYVDAILITLAEEPKDITKLISVGTKKVKITKHRLLKWGKVDVPSPVAKKVVDKLNDLIFGDPKGMPVMQYFDDVMNGIFFEKIKSLGGVV